jgi:hypothetical protein
VTRPEFRLLLEFIVFFAELNLRFKLLDRGGAR